MGDRNGTVDLLRALAALAVCFFHFTRFDYFAGVSVIEPVCRYGAVGVEVFFVTSGFIVPYAMQRGGYTLRAWPTFMWKRLLRLEPPYLVSIALVLVLDAASMQLSGAQHGERPVLVLLALAASLATAYALYGAVERPSRLLAGRFRYAH